MMMTHFLDSHWFYSVHDLCCSFLYQLQFVKGLSHRIRKSNVHATICEGKSMIIFHAFFSMRKFMGIDENGSASNDGGRDGDAHDGHDSDDGYDYAHDCDRVHDRAHNPQSNQNVRLS